MTKAAERITHRITLPSHAFSQFLRKAIFDDETFALVMENTEMTLKNHNITTSDDVSEEALMQLRFILMRAHGFVKQEKINEARFEQIFGINVAASRYQDISAHFVTKAEAKAEFAQRIDTQSDIFYSEQQSESHRGINVDFEQNSMPHTRTNHHYSTKFDGRDLMTERFIRTPLLNALTLGDLMARIDRQLTELGDF